MTDLRRLSNDDGVSLYELIVTNDHRRRVNFEAVLGFAGIETRARLERRDGASLWRVRLPATGRRVLRFTVREE